MPSGEESDESDDATRESDDQMDDTDVESEVRGTPAPLTWSNSVFRHCGNFGGCAVTVAGRAPCVSSLLSLSL